MKILFSSSTPLQEGGSMVVVKVNHDSNGQVRGSSGHVVDGLHSSNGSIDKANVNPEVAAEHDAG